MLASAGWSRRQGAGLEESRSARRDEQGGQAPRDDEAERNELTTVYRKQNLATASEALGSGGRRTRRNDSGRSEACVVYATVSRPL